MNLTREFLRLATTLRDAGVPYALCGGLAVVLHGYPRFTRDIDILVRPEDLEPALAAVAGIGFTLPGGVLPFDVGGPHERSVHRVSKRDAEGILTLDFLLVAPWLEDVWAGRETFDLGGVPVDAVSREGLVTLKRIAGRRQDLADLENLGAPDDG